MSIPENWTHRYNAPIPPEFVCALSKKVMHKPLAAVCEQGHTPLFDYDKIAQLVRSTWICPVDGQKITQIYPMPMIRSLYDRWHKEHVLIKVEPRTLAEWILLPHFRPNLGSCTLMGSMLRFIQDRHKIEETASHLVRLARHYEMEIPDERRRVPKELDPHAACVFELILAKAKLEIKNQPVAQCEPEWDPLEDISEPHHEVSYELVVPDLPRGQIPLNAAAEGSSFTNRGSLFGLVPSI